MAGPGAMTTTQIDNATGLFIDKYAEVAENTGVTDKLGRTVTLPKGYGLTGHFPYDGALPAAVPIVDGELFMNAQTWTDTDVTVSAQRYAIQTLISKYSNEQVQVDMLGRAGRKMANSMKYTADVAGIINYQSFAGLLGSTTTTLVVGHLDAAFTAIVTGIPQSGSTARTGARTIGSNTVDPADSKITCVLHSRQLRAIRAQLSGLHSGTSDGTLTSVAPAMGHGVNRRDGGHELAQWVLRHYRGQLIDMGAVTLLVDDNIPIDAVPSCKGWMAEENAMLNMNYSAPHHADKETEDGLYRRITIADAWGWGVLKEAGGYVIQTAAAVPTS